MKEKKECLNAYLVLLVMCILLNIFSYKIIEINNNEISAELMIFILTLVFTGYVLGRLDAFSIYSKKEKKNDN